MVADEHWAMTEVVSDAGTIADDVVSDHLKKYRPKLFSFVAISNVLGTEFPVARCELEGRLPRVNA